MDKRYRKRMAFSSIPSREKFGNGTSSTPNVMTPTSELIVPDVYLQYSA